jgi:hypothetical protein
MQKVFSFKLHAHVSENLNFRKNEHKKSNNISNVMMQIGPKTLRN